MTIGCRHFFKKAAQNRKLDNETYLNIFLKIFEAFTLNQILVSHHISLEYTHRSGLRLPMAVTSTADFQPYFRKAPSTPKDDEALSTVP
jgi:hypothetical protein